MKTLIFDIETKNIFETVGSRDPADLDISVVCLYESESEAYLSFTEEQFPSMWPYFQNAERLVTYNGTYFDIPCLQTYAPCNLSEINHVDLFVSLQQASGKRIGLDSVAQATLGIQKSGHGLDAVAWWNAGEVQKIIDYCIQDVKVTKALYDYAREHGSLSYFDRHTGGKIDANLDTSVWEKDAHCPTQGGLF